MVSIGNFYLDSVRGRHSAEVFNGTFCIYSLLERRLSEYLKPYNLSSVKFNALILIKYKGGLKGLSQNEISQHLIVHPSSITRLLDRLHKDGYITREECSEDRRSKRVKITPKGSEIVAKVVYGYGETVQQSVYLLERAEVKQLSSLMLKWFVELDKQAQGESDESA